MQRARLLLAIALVGSACAAPAKDSAAKAAGPLIPQDPIERQMTIGSGYALVTAMMVNKDGRSIVGLYAPDAVLVLPDSTVRNAPAIAERWVELAGAKSMADFVRTSQGMAVIDDSTLADSGSYLMTLKRTATDSVLERGHYKALWRARPGVGTWVMLEDQLTADAGKKKDGK